MNRFFAIVCTNKNNNIENIIKKLNTKDIIIFYKDETYISNINTADYLNSIKIPTEADNGAKIKNFAIRYMKENYPGWLHLLEDSIDILRDPNIFINDIEHTLDVFDLNNYFSTVTDVCNYVYSKYNPRITINMDYFEFEKLKLPNISFTSNANVQWIVINTIKADNNELYFNENFSIAMFYIIEFLARRKHTHPNSLYLMNQYLTVQSEHGLFINNITNQSDDAANKELLQKENALFKSLNINIKPDNNVDSILEAVYNKLLTKI